jgi:hypothetical protein
MVAFSPGRDGPQDFDNERFYVVRDEAALLRATRDELSSGVRTRELLVDNLGRVCRIAEIMNLGPATPLWRRILLLVFGQAGAIKQRVRCEFIEDESMSFDAVKRRVWASIEGHKDDWIDDEAMAGEGGEPLELDSIIATAKAAVDRSNDLKELFENLDAAWPY